MSNAAILKRLAGLNLPTEAFQEVLSIIADLQAADEKRRENSRQRTSRWRNGNATVTAQERHSDSHTPPRAYTTPPKKIDSKRNLSTLIPENFSPDLSFAESKGWTRQRAEAESQRFRDHALAKGRRCRDWPAAWRNWVTSPFNSPAINGASNGHDPHERQPGESLGALGRRLAAEAREQERAAGIVRPDDPF